MSPYEALVLALNLAVHAPDESKSQQAVALAESLISDFGISEFDVRRAQKEVES